jgi:hypothetical protein
LTRNIVWTLTVYAVDCRRFDVDCARNDIDRRFDHGV